MKLRYIILILWLGVIFAVSSIPGSTIPSAPSITPYIVHFCEYFVLGVILYYIAHAHDKPTEKVLIVVFIFGLLYGMSDEIHQLFVPGREFSLWDWAADIMGLIVGHWIAKHWIHRKLKTENEK